jgi:hypothetical protein
MVAREILNVRNITCILKLDFYTPIQVLIRAYWRVRRGHKLNTIATSLCEIVSRVNLCAYCFSGLG